MLAALDEQMVSHQQCGEELWLGDAIMEARHRFS